MPMQQHNYEQSQQQQPSANYPKLDPKYGFTVQEQAMIVEATSGHIAAASEVEKNNIRMKILNMDRALSLRCQAQGIDPFFLYCRSRVVTRLLAEKQRDIASQKPSQGMQTSMPQSTVPMEQRWPWNPNDGETKKLHQQMLGNADFGFQDRDNPQHQNFNPCHSFQGTSQPGFLLNAQHAWEWDEYWAKKARKQNSEDVDSEGEKMAGGAKAGGALLSTTTSNANETSSIKPTPLTEAKYGTQGLEDSAREDFGLAYNELAKPEIELPDCRFLQELYEDVPSFTISRFLQETDGEGFAFPTSRFVQEPELEYDLEESKLEGHAKPCWSEHISAADEATVEEHCTDSGYASILQTDICKNDLPLPDNQQCRVDDKSNVKTGDEDTVDSKTDYSAATSIDHLPRSQQYITELCSDIFNRLENHFNSTNWDTLEIALPSLIKAFAINIGFDPSAQVNQHIMYFIHKQHRLVISTNKPLMRILMLSY